MTETIKRILINANQPEEVRVATVSGNRLEDIDIEYPSQEQKKSNIYLATIGRIEPSLEAVFVNYGATKHGFLPIKEIENSYFQFNKNKNPNKNQNKNNDIKDLLYEGQELLVQVEKEERGNKGAALTTFISLAGRYLVLMPNNSQGGGVSRRIEGEERLEMKELLSALNIPEGMSVIIRTAGLGKKVSDLQWDLDILLHLWQSIKNAAGSLQAPCLLHQESNVIIRAIRDNLKQNIKEIIIDNHSLFEQAKKYLELIRSDSKNIIKLYNSDTPLFTRFQIESQIEEAYQHEVKLPSGGSIVFDRTEALTAIDINSAQSTKGQDIENTALHTNLEAADEIARQLRLRDVGGLVVIDFIDMSFVRNQREVENRLKNALQDDRARIQLSRISKFGILEMSRQRLKSSLGENTQNICSKCQGKGSVRTIESLSLSLLRIIEENCIKPDTKEVQCQLPIELCSYLTNEKRKTILKIEKRTDTRIILLPNQYYSFPNYKVSRIKDNNEPSTEKSYNIIELPDDEIYSSKIEQTKLQPEKAAVNDISKINKENIGSPKQNLLKKLWSSIFSSNKQVSTQQTTVKSFKKQENTKQSKNNRNERTNTQKTTRTSLNNKKNTNPKRSNRKNLPKNNKQDDNKKVEHDHVEQVNKPKFEASFDNHRSSNIELYKTKNINNIKSERESNLKSKAETSTDIDIKNQNNNKNKNTIKQSISNTNNNIDLDITFVDFDNNNDVNNNIEKNIKIKTVKRNNDRIQLKPGQNQTKRRFNYKKKLPFEGQQYSKNTKDNDNIDQNNIIDKKPDTNNKPNIAKDLNKINPKFEIIDLADVDINEKNN